MRGALLWMAVGLGCAVATEHLMATYHLASQVLAGLGLLGLSFFLYVLFIVGPPPSSTPDPALLMLFRAGRCAVVGGCIGLVLGTMFDVSWVEGQLGFITSLILGVLFVLVVYQQTKEK